MNKKLYPLLCLALYAGLFACAPAPSDIPRDASRSWSLKSDFTWTWSADFEHGCVAWLAKAEWAHVFLFVDSQCAGRDEPGFLEGKKGLSYSSTSDHLSFVGYWSWTSEMWSDMLEFDEEGMLSGGNIHPCPYSLSQNQIDEIRIVATEALSTATTDGERRMLTRINDRLALTNGEALSSSQSGCTDESLDPNELASAEKVNPWDLSRNN